MVKKMIYCVGLLWLCAASVTAKKVEVDKAERIAARFASGFNNTRLKSAQTLQRVYTATAAPSARLRAANLPLFYIYNVGDNGGFVIIAGDDGVQPILAYADSGAFQADDMPDNLQGLLASYEKEITWWLDNGYEASDETLQKWNALLTDEVTIDPPLVLLETAKWDQQAPYNALCPFDSAANKRTYTGCVATAMGIAMKYYQHPAKGSGTIEYPNRIGTDNISISVDFNVAYDWANMLDTYTTTNGIQQWNAAQEQAVATLLYHCGAASRMNFQSSASGTTEFDALNGLITYLGYDEGTYIASRDLYTTDEWNDLLRNELNHARVVLYCGVTTELSGHLMLVDGYNTQGYYHINWGWSGQANGLYLLSSLEPTSQGIGGSSEGSGYALYQGAFIGMQAAQSTSTPNHELYFIDLNTLPIGYKPHFDVCGLSVTVDTITTGNPFRLKFSFLTDYGQRDFDGLYGFFIFDKNDSIKETLETFTYHLPGDHMLYSDDGTQYTITSDIAPGDKIRMYYSSNKTDWKPVRGLANAVLEIPLGITATTTSEPTPTNQQPEVITTPDALHVRSNAPIQQISLFNLTGALLDSQTYSADADTRYATLSIQHLPSGAYILSIQTTAGQSEQKILKQ